jgi:hypothetical protein
MEMSRRSLLVTMGAAGATAAGASVLLAHPQSSLPTRGAGEWTSFGTVVLLGWSRLALAGSADHEQSHVQSHVHAPSDAPVPSAVHGAWTDAVMVDVQVHNGSRGPIELSPGQFRVRVDDGGPTVSLYSSDRSAGRLEAGETANLRISYLVPPPEAALSLEFADAISSSTHRLGRLDDRSDA